MLSKTLLQGNISKQDSFTFKDSEDFLENTNSPEADNEHSIENSINNDDIDNLASAPNDISFDDSRNTCFNITTEKERFSRHSLHDFNAIKSDGFNRHSNELITEEDYIGYFYKLGNNGKVWKKRSYTISHSDDNSRVILNYLHPVSNKTKGTIMINSIEFKIADIEVKNSFLESEIQSIVNINEVIAITLVLPDEEYKIINLIFDSLEESKKFFKIIKKYCLENNAQVIIN